MFAEILATAWWLLLLRGVAAVLFGLLALFAPGITLVALTLAFAILVLIDGVLLVAAALTGRKHDRSWGLLLVEGIVALIFGGLALGFPQVTTFVLLMFIASFALITGILRVVAAIRLRKEITGEWRLALSGAASFIFAVLLMAMPTAGALAVAVYIGLWALVVGVALIALAFRVRRFAHRGSDVWHGGHPATAH